MATLEVTGGDDVRRMLDRHTGREAHNRLRRAVRAGSKEFQQGLKDAAASEPTGNVPASFKKVPAPKISASTRRGGEIVGKVRPKSPLFNIFEPGAGHHEIVGASVGAMGGPAGGDTWTAEGRKRPRAFSARGRVRHPGMKARPIMPTAFGAKKQSARVKIASVLFEPGS